jgi:hypothetical protein
MSKMNGESALNHIESKLDSHIEQHNEDYRKLLYWAISILLGLIGTLGTWFITFGSLQEKIHTIEAEQQDLVTREEYQGLKNLLDERLRNINEKLDRIITATR